MKVFKGYMVFPETGRDCGSLPISQPCTCKGRDMHYHFKQGAGSREEAERIIREIHGDITTVVMTGVINPILPGVCELKEDVLRPGIYVLKPGDELVLISVIADTVLVMVSAIVPRKEFLQFLRTNCMKEGIPRRKVRIAKETHSAPVKQKQESPPQWVTA